MMNMKRCIKRCTAMMLSALLLCSTEVMSAKAEDLPAVIQTEEAFQKESGTERTEDRANGAEAGEEAGNQDRDTENKAEEKNDGEVSDTEHDSNHSKDHTADKEDESKNDAANESIAPENKGDAKEVPDGNENDVPSDETKDEIGAPADEEGDKAEPEDKNPGEEEIPDSELTEKASEIPEEEPETEEFLTEEALYSAVSYAGNTINSATGISPGQTVNGQISETNAKDFYSFELNTSGHVSFSGTYNMQRVNIMLYNAQGEKIWDASPYWNSTTQQIIAAYNFDLTSGTYYLCAERYSSSSNYTGSYNFKLSFTSSNESFREPQGGDNNSLSAADGISLGTGYKGQLALNDSKDFYRFKLNTSGCVKLSGTYHMQWVYVRVYDEMGNEIWWKNPYWNNVTQQIVLEENLYLTSGTYYFCVEKNSGHSGNYDFKLSFTASDESFQETQGGNNNSIETADGISFNSSYTGQIAINDTKDFYMFNVGSDRDYTLVLSAQKMKWIYVYLYDGNGNQLKRWNPGQNSSGYIYFSQEISLSKGKYYICFQRNDSYGNYRFKVSSSGSSSLAGWEQQAGKWYYYNSNGIKLTGWQKLDGKWYYLDGSGAMQTRWCKVSGKWYYLGADGVMRSGWQKLDGKWYYFDGSGVMQTTWSQIAGKWYYFGADGAMRSGWQKVSAKWYYLDSSGVMQIKWCRVSGRWYYLGTDGVMRSGWQKLDGKWYYLDGGGVLQTGWHQISGKWYYLGTDGVMRTRWQKADNKWYYLDDSGVMQTGWLKLDGQWYYFKTDGSMVNTDTYIAGKKHRFNSKGVWLGAY